MRKKLTQKEKNDILWEVKYCLEGLVNAGKTAEKVTTVELKNEVFIHEFRIVISENCLDELAKIAKKYHNKWMKIPIYNK